ncbi:MAG: DUF1289 domain-containing protein [Caldimonas sp.]
MTVASPCTQVCAIAEATGRCAGCQRTLAEIAALGVLDDDAKRAVLALLPARHRGDSDSGIEADSEAGAP